MDSKIMLLLVTGIVIGGGIGFVYTTSINKPIIENLNSENANLLSNVNALTAQNTAIQNQYNTLQNRYSSLQTGYNTLNAQYTELSQQNSQLETEYDKLITKYQLLLASVPLESISFSGTLTTKNYRWSYLGQTWTLSLNIPDSTYDYYQSLERTPTEDYSVYVTHPYDDAYLATIIEKFNIIAITNSLTEAEKINLVIAFVQSLPYAVDSVTTGYDEYPRYPAETLIDDGGDCEDTSILTAALLHVMNYNVILINPPGHMAVGVNIPGTYGSYYNYEEKEYFYLETTGDGWKIGELPNEYKGTSAYLYSLNPIPIVTHTWKAEWVGGKLAVSVTVKNVGTKIASGYKVKVGLDAGDDMWRDVETSNDFDLAPGREVVINLTITPTPGYNTRIIVFIINDQGYKIDESYSTWFDT